MSKSAASKFKSQLKRKKEHKLYVTERNKVKLEELKQMILKQVDMHERTISAYRQFLNIISDDHRKIFESLESFASLEEQFTGMQTILTELKEMVDSADDIQTYEQFFKVRFTELNYRQTQFAANLMESSKSLDVEIQKQTPVSSIKLSDDFLPETGELIEETIEETVDVGPSVSQEEYELKLSEHSLNDLK